MESYLHALNPTRPSSAAIQRRGAVQKHWQHAAEEARRNLELRDPARLKDLRALLARCTVSTALVAELRVVLEPKDAPILGRAIAGKATHLLTGDARHFQRHYGKTIRGVKVVSPKMLADELVSRSII